MLKRAAASLGRAGMAGDLGHTSLCRRSLGDDPTLGVASPLQEVDWQLAFVCVGSVIAALVSARLPSAGKSTPAPGYPESDVTKFQMALK
jgi:hypothetical protein